MFYESRKLWTMYILCTSMYVQIYNFNIDMVHTEFVFEFPESLTFCFIDLLWICFRCAAAIAPSSLANAHRFPIWLLQAIATMETLLVFNIASIQQARAISSVVDFRCRVFQMKIAWFCRIFEVRLKVHILLEIYKKQVKKWLQSPFLPRCYCVHLPATRAEFHEVQ